MKKIGIITTMILGGGLIYGGVTFTPQSTSAVPPYDIVIDEPNPIPDEIRARFELITAGELYHDRQINVTVSKKTAQENKDVFLEYNTVVTEKTNLNKQEKDRSDFTKQTR